MSTPRFERIIRVTVSTIAAIGLAAATGCGSSATNSSTTASEIAEGALSGGVNGTEPGGSSGAFYQVPTQSKLQMLASFLNPISSSIAGSACPTFKAGTCSSGNVTLTYDDCSFGSSAATWTGSQTITFAAGCPADLKLSTLMSGGLTLTRTFGTGTYEVNGAGEKTALDTTTAATSGYDSTVTVPGEGEQAIWNSTGRTFQILGLHLTGSINETYDHTISSSALNVTGSSTTRALSNGTVTVQHNLAKYTAVVTISNLTWGLANCCHPTSGSFSTAITGSVTGTETLTFSDTSCGAASLTTTSGATSAITLGHCF